MVSYKDWISPALGFLSTPDPSPPLLICWAAFHLLQLPPDLSPFLKWSCFLFALLCWAIFLHAPLTPFPCLLSSSTLTVFPVILSSPELSFLLFTACYFLHSLWSSPLLLSCPPLPSFVLSSLPVFSPDPSLSMVPGMCRNVFSVGVAGLDACDSLRADAYKWIQ